MIRRSVAGAILGLSLLIGSFAWSGFLALRTVFDPDRSREVAAELLDNDEVRAQLATNTSFAVRSVVPPQVPVDPALIDQVTVQLLESPAVEAAILNAFADTHAAFLGEGDVPDRIDLTAVAQVARETLVSASPELDGVIGEDLVLSVPLPTERIPDASPVRNALRTAVPILAALAIGGAVLALVTTTDRPAILRRAGFWALATTAVYLIIGLGIPYLLREFAPEQAEVLAALLAALLRSTLVPSLVLGAVGVGALVLSGAWSAARAGGGGRRTEAPARARQSPDPDAPHRRRVAAMDRAHQTAPPAPTPQPAPAGRRSAPPQRTAVQPVVRRAPGDPAQPPLSNPSRSPQSSAPPVRPAQPAPAAQAARLPERSPYPDAEHWAATHPDQAPPPAGPTASQAAPAVAERAASASIFDDVPLPSEPQPLRQQTPAPTPVDRQPPSNSVFDTPAAPRASAPPAGARFDAQYGWVLDPDSPDPRPAEALWVDGVGWTLPQGET